MTRWLPVLAILALAARAHADKPEPGVQAKADVLFEKAQADYQAGQYQGAIELFKQAYEAVHDPVYLFNIAQSYRKVLDCEAAFDYYSRYLSEAPNAENQVKVRQWLTELTPCVEQRKQEHEAARRGEEVDRQHKAEQVQRTQAVVTGQETEVDHGRTLRIAGLAVGAVGVVGIGVGVAYSIQGAHIKQQIANLCTGTATCTWDMATTGKTPSQLDSDGTHANTMAKIGYIGGGATAAVGIALYMLGRARVEHVIVTPADGGAAVSAQLRF